MAFLRKSDYVRLITVADLNTITGSDDTIIVDQEKSSQEELCSFIRHRYETGLIFKDIKTFVYTTQYNTGDLIEWSETAYDSIDTYNTGDRCSYSGYIYSATEDGVTGTWDSGKWTQLAANESLYYCIVPSLEKLPTDAISYTSSVYTDNHKSILGWDKETYGTLYFLRYENEIQIYLSSSDRSAKINKIGYFEYPYEGIELPVTMEIKPGGSPYNILSGEVDIIGFISEDQTWDIAATYYWQSGDNRNPKIVELLMDITLYHLYTRVQPRNIPTHVINRYDGGTERQTAGAIGYLKMVQKGEIQLDLPTHQDDSRGQAISYGSNPKLNYNY